MAQLPQQQELNESLKAQPINDVRKTSLLKSMYAVSYLNHTFNHTFKLLESTPQKIYISRDDHRPNREFPMRQLPYCDTDYKLNNSSGSDVELDDSELDVIVD